MLDLSKKLVLVMGGGRGIGAAVVQSFAAHGATVIIGDTDSLTSNINHYQSKEVKGYQAATLLAQKLNEQGRSVKAYNLNALDEECIATFFANIAAENQTNSRSGRIDVVVNAFGITHVATIDTMLLEDFKAVIDGNLTATFIMTKHAVIHFKKYGNAGSIINFSSIAGRQGFSKVSHYCAAKFGVIGLTSSVAKEVAAHKITVNAICPGIVKTNMWEYLLQQFQREGETTDACWQRMCNMIPQKAAQTPESIAQAVLMLSQNQYITGQVISVDGGMYDAA